MEPIPNQLRLVLRIAPSVDASWAPTGMPLLSLEDHGHTMRAGRYHNDLDSVFVDLTTPALRMGTARHYARLDSA